AGVGSLFWRRRRVLTAAHPIHSGSYKMPRYFTASLALLVLGAFAIEPAQAVLVAHYQFENNLNDSSSNGHTGTFVGTTSIVNDPVRGNVLNVPESGNQGVNIDTVVPIPDFVANSSITLTAWYKRQ